MQSPSPAGLAARRRPRRRTQRPPSPSPSDRASQSGGLYIALARRSRWKVYPWYPPLLWPQFSVPVVTATNLGPWELGFDGQPDTREAEGRRLDARYLGRFIGWLRLLEDGKCNAIHLGSSIGQRERQVKLHVQAGFSRVILVGMGASAVHHRLVRMPDPLLYVSFN